MDEPRHPAENPYRHEKAKPHLVDRDEIRGLCLECLHILLASNGMAVVLGEEEGGKTGWDYPNLTALHHRNAESQLSSKLLKLAVLVRTFDDQFRDVEAYTEHKRTIDRDQGPFGDFYEGSGILAIREGCNKIIHAEDVRPVYENGGEPHDEGMWAMNGIIELTGYDRGEKWSVGLRVIAFLEAVIDLIWFGTPSGR
jgi:hypothetical protein